MTEEIKKEADSVVDKYNIKQRKGNNLSDENYTMSTYQIITAAIQDRQSVLDENKSVLEMLKIHGDERNRLPINERIQSLTKQIEYLKTKLK